jgi:predicted component of type VI protein secretion system
MLLMKGGQVLSEHPLPPGAELVVGRSEGCEVTIADSSVSRLHARLVADGEGVYVEDLGSANGTFVDGSRVRGRVRLGDGQEVRVAQRAQAAPFVLRLVDARAATVDGPPTTGDIRERWARFAAESSGGDGEVLPGLPPTPAANQPLWRIGAPEPVPMPLVTMPVTESPRPAPPSAGASREPPPSPAAVSLSPQAGTAFPPPVAVAVSRRAPWPWAIAALAVLVVLGAALVAWWWERSRGAAADARAEAIVASAASPAPAPRPAAVTAVPPVIAAVPAASPSLSGEVLVMAATPTVTNVAAQSAPPAALPASSLAGRWAARLENVFYPEDDYVIELRLDLRQRGGEVSGTGKVTVEGRAMTFGVPGTTVSGTVRRGPPPWPVRLRLPFGRPIGELQLEGTLDGDALAGTFRSSAAKQPGAWQAVRSQR